MNCEIHGCQEESKSCGDIFNEPTVHNADKKSPNSVYLTVTPQRSDPASKLKLPEMIFSLENVVAKKVL